jgi:hypothetical protein
MESNRTVLRDKIALSNGLLLEAWDFSRKHAGDRWQVVLGCRIAIRLERTFFPSDSQGEAAYRKLVSVYGSVISYEFMDERNFVSRRDLDSTWRNLFEEFKEASLSYLSHPRFSEKFARATFTKLIKNPYKLRLEQKTSIFNRLGEREAPGL